MEYIKRELERKILKMNTHFKAILVTGARQAGKTTMLKHLSQGTNRTYVSLDNRMARDLAKSDPVLFFQTYQPPILIYENYVVMELVKAYAYSKVKANLSYYRDSNAKEIDIFIENNNTIHPIEIKKSANPNKRETKKYSVIDKTSLKRGNGGIICMCEEVMPIDSENCFIPSNII